MRWTEKLVWCVAVPALVSFLTVTLVVNNRWDDVQFLFYSKLERFKEVERKTDLMNADICGIKEKVKQFDEYLQSIE